MAFSTLRLNVKLLFTECNETKNTKRKGAKNATGKVLVPRDFVPLTPLNFNQSPHPGSLSLYGKGIFKALEFDLASIEKKNVKIQN